MVYKIKTDHFRQWRLYTDVQVDKTAKGALNQSKLFYDFCKSDLLSPFTNATLFTINLNIWHKTANSLIKKINNNVINAPN